MNLAPQVQILNEAVCISYYVNTLGKIWIQLFSLQLWVDSRVDWLINFGKATDLKERNFWIQIGCRPGEGRALPGYFHPRHTTWVASQQLEKIMETVRENAKNKVVFSSRFQESHPFVSSYAILQKWNRISYNCNRKQWFWAIIKQHLEEIQCYC